MLVALEHLGKVWITPDTVQGDTYDGALRAFSSGGGKEFEELVQVIFQCLKV